MKRIVLWFILGVTLLGATWGAGRVSGARGSSGARWVGGGGVAEMPASPAQFLPATTDSTGPLYGVNFMSSAEDPADDQQYANALSTGARWNRWPLYWYNIEQNPGQFNWSAQDATIIADLAHGLQIDAILLGTPGFYLTGGLATFPSTPSPAEMPAGPLSLTAPQTATPVGLYEPIFTDGTDVPGPGKTINPDNKWANFVSAAIKRYKPDGILAQANGWPDGVGITHWEMWNEPDLPSFWDGSVADYARLLKVGYLAAKTADDSAQVLFGGLANNFSGDLLNFYENVLDIYDADPLAANNGYFHDILATHSYYYAWQSWYHVFRAGNSLGAHGLDAGDELTRTERLGDVVVGAGLEASDLVLLLATRSEHDDRDRAGALLGPQTARELHARHPGQHPVEQHEVRKGFTNQALGGFGIGSTDHMMARTCEVGSNELLDCRLVFDQKNICRHRDSPLTGRVYCSILTFS